MSRTHYLSQQHHHDSCSFSNSYDLSQTISNPLLLPQQAICNCLELMLTLQSSSAIIPFLIISDSLASLNVISNPTPTHSLVRYTHPCSSRHAHRIPHPHRFLLDAKSLGYSKQWNNPNSAKLHIVTNLPTFATSLIPTNSEFYMFMYASIYQRWFSQWNT